MRKNITILAGSPRRGACSDTLAAALATGCEEAGHKVTTHYVADLKIGGCLGCGNCFQTPGECVQKDDMLSVLENMRNADALVLASPIYFFNISGQLKLAIDRFYSLLATPTRISRAALLITSTSPAAVAAPAIGMFEQILAYLKWENGGCLVATGLKNPRDLDGRPELAEARQLGLKLF
jgi:multimeric flavodoxin WrbA